MTPTGDHGFTVQNNGNVGIGTASPNSNLQISDTNPAIHITDTDATGKTASLWQHDDVFKIGEAFASTIVNIDLSTENVGIGTASPAGKLDVASTTGALIVPRMTTAQRNAMTAVNGSIIYNTSTNQFNFYENGSWVTK